MKTFREFLQEKGETDLLESRPYTRAVNDVAQHQNIVKTGEKASVTNQMAIADQMSKKVPKGSNA